MIFKIKLFTKSVIVLAILFLTGNVLAVNIGGEMDIRNYLSYNTENQKPKVGWSGVAELEFFLPQTNNLDPRMVLLGDLSSREVDLDFKYAYLRYRYNGGHLTLGRQPVSWSYGSIINPLGYGPGVAGLAGETIRPDVNGIRYLRFLGAGSTLQLIGSFPEGNESSFDRLGYGLRLRFPGTGHDISFNMITQPVSTGGEETEDNLIRVGTIYSGDLGPIGVYGALGYFHLYEAELDEILSQVGIDYSWQVGPRYRERLIYFQAEYLRFWKENSGGLAQFQQFTDLLDITLNNGAAENTQDLFVGNLVLQLDYFSEIGLGMITDTGDIPLIIAPFYQNDLGGDLELRIEGNIWVNNNDVSIGTGAGLKYYF